MSTRCGLCLLTTPRAGRSVAAMNDTIRLAVECSAATKSGKFVTLPAGTEVHGSASSIREAISVPELVEFECMARSPKAKSPAFYRIDASDLWLALQAVS